MSIRASLNHARSAPRINKNPLGVYKLDPQYETQSEPQKAAAGNNNNAEQLQTESDPTYETEGYYKYDQPHYNYDNDAYLDDGHNGLGDPSYGSAGMAFVEGESVEDAFLLQLTHMRKEHAKRLAEIEKVYLHQDVDENNNNYHNLYYDDIPGPPHQVHRNAFLKFHPYNSGGTYSSYASYNNSDEEENAEVEVFGEAKRLYYKTAHHLTGEYQEDIDDFFNDLTRNPLSPRDSQPPISKYKPKVTIPKPFSFTTRPPIGKKRNAALATSMTFSTQKQAGSSVKVKPKYAQDLASPKVKRKSDSDLKKIQSFKNSRSSTEFQSETEQLSNQSQPLFQPAHSSTEHQTSQDVKKTPVKTAQIQTEGPHQEEESPGEVDEETERLVEQYLKQYEQNKPKRAQEKNSHQRAHEALDPVDSKEEEVFEPFKARPVPEVVKKPIYKELEQQERERKERQRLRALVLKEKASEPFSSQQKQAREEWKQKHVEQAKKATSEVEKEFVFSPKIHTAPNFQKLHSKWEGELERKKKMNEPTKPKAFQFQTESVPSNKMKVIEDILADEQYGRETRWPYKATRGKPEPSFTPVFAPPETDSKTTLAAEMKKKVARETLIKRVQQQQQERQKLQQIKQKEKIMAQKIAPKLHNKDSQLKKENTEKIKAAREAQQQATLEYKKALDEKLKQMDENRTFLFERVDINDAKRKALRQADALIGQAGLRPEDFRYKTQPTAETAKLTKVELKKKKSSDDDDDDDGSDEFESDEEEEDEEEEEEEEEEEDDYEDEYEEDDV